MMRANEVILGNKVVYEAPRDAGGTSHVVGLTRVLMLAFAVIAVALIVVAIAVLRPSATENGETAVPSLQSSLLPGEGNVAPAPAQPAMAAENNPFAAAAANAATVSGSNVKRFHCDLTLELEDSGWNTPNDALPRELRMSLLRGGQVLLTATCDSPDITVSAPRPPQSTRRRAASEEKPEPTELQIHGRFFMDDGSKASSNPRSFLKGMDSAVVQLSFLSSRAHVRHARATCYIRRAGENLTVCLVGFGGKDLPLNDGELAIPIPRNSTRDMDD